MTAFLFVLLGYSASAHAASSVTLAWDPSGSEVAGYNVYYGSKSGDYTEVVDAGNQTSATISSLSSGIAYYFAVTAYNTTGLESLPTAEIPYTPTANQAPVAVDDSAATDEGFPVTINVLSNDSDPDDGPSPLTIQSVGDAANGTTAVAGSGVTYSPGPGFFGTDTFTYTITDGMLSASATVTVTVQSTAQADDLIDAAGLTGTNIGTGTGGSRVLSSGYWELTGEGIGPSGISDALYFDSKDKRGDFQVLARIHSVESDGAAPEVGLMVRESTDADARFAMISATPKAYTYASRTIVGGSASKNSVALTAEFPNVWVLIQRTGDLVEFAISTDGSTFDFVGSTVIESLANNIKVGLFASSGTPGVDVRAIVTDYTEFDIAPASDGTGLTGRYYAGKNFDTLLLTRVENINFDWGSDSPDPSVPNDDFSVRWIGKLAPKYSEDYTLYTLANNGIRVWLNDELLIDDWNTNRETEASATIPLEAGQMYNIRVEFLEEHGQANVTLSWSSASQPKEIVPVGALYPDER